MTGKILLGIGLGILLGLFLGEPAGRLGVIGDVFVGLLQMTVLPFMVLSLVANIGRFSVAEGRALAKIGSLVLLLLFGLSLAALVVLPLSFPVLKTGAFFSASILETREPPDFFALYIPSNPFHSLAENLVPAAVLFSILLGVALTGLEKKEQLLGPFDIAIQALGRVNGFVVRMTPIGVFAIAASAAGTLTVEEFGRLQAYILTHTFGVLLMTFVVVPATISFLTPLSYGAILKASKDFLLTAWATGSLFAVLPMLIESIETLLADQDWVPKGGNAKPAVLVPLGYPFPTVGKLLALIFVPFTAWFLGSPMDAGDYPVFLSAGLFASFGSLVVTIPFLLELLKLPIDFFNLFLMAGVWSARLGDLAGGMHLLAFAVLTMAGLAGKLRFQARRALVLGAGVVAVTALIVVGTRTILASTFAGRYERTEAMTSLHDPKEATEVRILERGIPNPVPLEEGTTRIERAVERGALRVGYHAGSQPWVFFNEQGDVVGFDIDLVRRLAIDLGVDIELVPFEPETLESQLEADHFDFAVGGIFGTLDLAHTFQLPEPYLIGNGALLVPDHRRKQLDTLEELRRMGDELTLAVLPRGFSTRRMRRLLPEVRLVEIASEAEFFDLEDVDGLAITAEGGSSWTLSHPEYSVVLPILPPPQVPLVFAAARSERQLVEWLNRWIEWMRTDGVIDEVFVHWIQGEGLADKRPRWCIGSNVLGWW